MTRLRDMGVESFLLSSSLAGIIAQRLVRRLCPQCRQFTPVSPQQAQMFKHHQLAVTTIGTPVGCPHCHQSGYQGRMAIHEMMVVTPELRAAIHENVDEQALERLVRQQHNALIKNGLQKVIRGDTSWMRLCASPVPRWRTKHELSLSRHDPGWSKIAGDH